MREDEREDKLLEKIIDDRINKRIKVCITFCLTAAGSILMALYKMGEFAYVNATKLQAAINAYLDAR